MKYMVQYHGNDEKFPRAHSQGGEDGIIAFVLDTLGVKTGCCVEVGALDGEFLSNTISQVRKGLDCLMIEGDTDRFEKLVRNAAKPEYDGRIIPVCAMVNPSNIRGILERNLPESSKHGLRVLSIDIDGGEHLIWNAIPWFFTVVVAEWNDRGNKHPWGLLNEAEKSGYRPLSCTNSNIIFVHKNAYGELCRRMAGSEV